MSVTFRIVMIIAAVAISSVVSWVSQWDQHCDTQAKTDINKVKACSAHQWSGATDNKKLLNCCLKVESICITSLIGRSKCKPPPDMKIVTTSELNAVKEVADKECKPYGFGAKDCKALKGKTKPVPESDALCRQYLPCFDKFQDHMKRKPKTIDDLNEDDVNLKQGGDDTKPNEKPDQKPDGEKAPKTNKALTIGFSCGLLLMTILVPILHTIH